MSIIINKERLNEKDYNFIVEKLSQYNINDIIELKKLINTLGSQSWEGSDAAHNELINMSLVYILISQENINASLNRFVVYEVGQEELEIIEDQGRWDLWMRTVISISDRFFEISWSKGATEYQEDEWEYSYFIEVKPVKRTITDYEPI